MTPAERRAKQEAKERFIRLKQIAKDKGLTLVEFAKPSPFDKRRAEFRRYVLRGEAPVGRAGWKESAAQPFQTLDEVQAFLMGMPDV